MRHALFLFATLVACGGSTATIPSSSSDPSGGEGAGSATPAAPPPAAVAPPPATPTDACSPAGAPTIFGSASQQSAALGAAWDACANAICPASAPHLFFARDRNDAACGQWCGGDGGFCASNDPHLLFTYAVSATPSGFVLELANQTDSDPRSYSIRYWTGSPSSSMELTDRATKVVTTLQTVGIPVK